MDVQPDGYVSVLVESPTAICDLVHAHPQAQADGSVQLPFAASDSPTFVLDGSKHRFGDKEEEPCCAEVGVIIAPKYHHFWNGCTKVPSLLRIHRQHTCARV
jgi:hypothetical protein